MCGILKILDLAQKCLAALGIFNKEGVDSRRDLRRYDRSGSPLAPTPPHASLFSVLFMLFASARTTTAFTPRTKLQTSLLRTPAAMAAFSAQPKAAAVEKEEEEEDVAAAAAHIQYTEEKRLFTTPNQSIGECLLLHDVQCLSLYNS